jgi:DNA-binding YbaB/EbfC family protein
MGGMLKQLRQMQADLVKAQKELAKETVTGEAGKGAVRVIITGDQKVTGVEIDASLVDTADTRKLAALVQEAANHALEASRELAKERLGPLSQGLTP